MKKLLTVMLTVALAATACCAVFPASAADEPTVQNLLNFAATDMGKNIYDPDTGEVMLYGDDTRVYVSTVLDYINDGKVKLADDTEKSMSELTFVMEAAVTPAILGGWQVPYLVFAKNGVDTYEYHVRANISGGVGTTSYIFQRADEVGNYAETNLRELPFSAGAFAPGDSYTVKIEYSGKNVSVYAYVKGELRTSVENLAVLPDSYTPIFSFGDRTNGETVISDMKYYIKDTQLANYATGMEIVEKPADTEYNADLSGGSFKVNYMDGTSETLQLSDLTVSGYNKNTVGKQTVTVSKAILNQQLHASFQVEVTDRETVAVSVNKTEYEYGEEFDLGTIVAVKQFISGRVDEPVETTASDFTISGYDKNVSGEQSVVITYNGKEYTVKVTVAEKKGGCKSSVEASLIGGALFVGIAAVVLFSRKKSH